jgi:phenylalanyl-tRNA synthetase alpha chain
MLNLQQKAIKEVKQAKDLKDLDEIYRKYLGRKGELTNILRSLKELSEKERRQKGREANQVKKELEEAIKTKREELLGKGRVSEGASGRMDMDKDWIDVTLPRKTSLEGHIHPLSLVQKEVEEIFQSMGFSVLDGPEMETEYYNFDALNIPGDHPARDSMDTFWLKNVVVNKAKQSRNQLGRIAASPSASGGNKLLLRTHTSPMQARYMEKHNPPLRIIVPGRCFRHERTDATHDVQFYQTEGLMVDDDISVANFKGIIEEFLKRFFGSEAKMRLRPGHFPFTEPSFEVDVMPQHFRHKKGKSWLEIMGAGMVHQNVFKAVGYPLRKWQGFAFGVGLDRLAMLKYKIDDTRLFYSGDLRFLRQF